MTMSDLQRYHRKLCLIKFSLDINNFVPLKCSFSFVCSQQKWISHFNRGKITEINTIQDRKTTLSCTFLIRLHCRMLMLGDNEMVYSVPTRHAIISCNVYWVMLHCLYVADMCRSKNTPSFFDRHLAATCCILCYSLIYGLRLQG